MAKQRRRGPTPRRPPASRKRGWLPWGAGGLVVALLAGFGLTTSLGGGKADEGPTFVAEGGGGCKTDTRMDVYSAPESVHIDRPQYKGPFKSPAKYKVNPPSGGDHVSQSLGPGYYDDVDDLPPDDLLVHSLEHGYVVLWYKPDAPAEDIRDIKEVQKGYPRDVLVVSRPSMPVNVAATAWGHRLLCKKGDPAVLADFVRKRRNKAPERIPH